MLLRSGIISYALQKLNALDLKQNLWNKAVTKYQIELISTKKITVNYLEF